MFYDYITPVAVGEFVEYFTVTARVTAVIAYVKVYLPNTDFG